jgi:nitroreductase/NAD-dependent dihydropyrimidine dehydrogenase PreA subunit
LEKGDTAREQKMVYSVATNGTGGGVYDNVHPKQLFGLTDLNEGVFDGKILIACGWSVSYTNQGEFAWSLRPVRGTHALHFNSKEKEVMELFTIDEQTCARDGICAEVCPVGVIDFEKGGYPRPAQEAEEICIRCGHCVAVCPLGSLSHSDLSVEECTPVADGLRISPAACEQFLRSRRSIRVYKDKKVSRDELQKLIEIARYAPSGHNSQGVKWLVLGDREELRRLSAIVVDWMRWVIANMPQMAAFLHLERTVGRWRDGEDVILRNAPTVIVAHAPKEDRMAPSTCTIALSYLELAASGRGLGTCWAGYFNAAASTFPPMMKALGLPEGHQSFGAMMVGYPAYIYRRLPVRNMPEITWRLE